MKMRKLVKDFGDDYTLIQDSQEVKAILEYIGSEEEPHALFVKVGDGDYEEVWGIDSFVPYNFLEAYRLK
uniref:Hypothetical protein TTMA177 n=2 Tax=root TaxID=1 RepID=D0VWQ2_9ZZZZ